MDADTLHSLILDATGNEDFAEFAMTRAESWRAQGYPAEVVAGAVRASVMAGVTTNMMAWSRWVTRRLAGWAARELARNDNEEGLTPAQQG